MSCLIKICSIRGRLPSQESKDSEDARHGDDPCVALVTERRRTHNHGVFFSDVPVGGIIDALRTLQEKIGIDLAVGGRVSESRHVPKL